MIEIRRTSCYCNCNRFARFFLCLLNIADGHYYVGVRLWILHIMLQWRLNDIKGVLVIVYESYT